MGKMSETISAGLSFNLELCSDSFSMYWEFGERMGGGAQEIDFLTYLFTVKF